MPKRHTEAVQHSSGDPNWRTPLALFQALHEEVNFQVDLAANADSTLLDCWLGPDSPFPDALKVRWGAEFPPGSTGFLNPPYSKEAQKPLREAGDMDRVNALDVHNWAAKAWLEAQRGFTTWGVFPFSPQTDWYRHFVMGHPVPRSPDLPAVPFFAAKEVRRFPHRVSFLRPDGSKAANAGGNSCIIVWAPMRGTVAPWVPAESYWTWRGLDEAQADAEETPSGEEENGDG